jgi:outer membrane lipopolysaccharide assembly protein LptE/RlpB
MRRDYSLEGPSGEVVVDTQSLRLSREYQFDAQAILGGRREEEFLGEDLSRAMAAQLMRQLSAEAQGAP